MTSSFKDIALQAGERKVLAKASLQYLQAEWKKVYL